MPGKGGARARESGDTAGGRPRTRPAAARRVRRVLCLGLLYHLDAPDVFQLLERMRDLCRDLVIIQTRVAPYPSERREHRGRQYLGMPFPEPPPDTPRLSSDALCSSIGNPLSFQLTRASLCDAFADVGYSSVLQCLQLVGPAMPSAAPRGGAPLPRHICRLHPGSGAHHVCARAQRSGLGSASPAVRSASHNAAAIPGLSVDQRAGPATRKGPGSANRRSAQVDDVNR
jgi:hypothetical protein